MSTSLQDQTVPLAAQAGEPLTKSRGTGANGRLPRSYVAAWVAAAALSGTYLTATALTGTPPMDADGNPQEASEQSDTARAVEIAEARAIKYKVSLEDFQRDVALLRNEFTGRSSDTTLVARLAAIEERLSIETGVAIAKLPAAAMPNSPAAVAATFDPSTNTASAGDNATANAAGSGTGGTSLKSPATRVAGAVGSVGPDGQPRISIPLETGSLQKTPTRAEPTRADVQDVLAPTAPSQSATGAAPPAGAVVLNAQPATPPAAPAGQAVQPRQTAAVVQPAPPPKPFAVQLASGGSVESLRLSWSVLSEQHGDTLRPLEPRVTKSAAAPGASPIYDLLAGPFKTAADARKACKTLATRGVDCKIGNFGGQTL